MGDQEPAQAGQQSPTSRQARLCAIYLRDAASFLPRRDVDRCRQTSMHALASILHPPRRHYSILSFHMVCTLPVPLILWIRINSSRPVQFHEELSKLVISSLWPRASFYLNDAGRMPCDISGKSTVENVRHNQNGVNIDNEIACCHHLKASGYGFACSSLIASSAQRLYFRRSRTYSSGSR